MPTTDELQQQIDELRTNFNKNEYSNLSVFLKQVLFKAGVTMNGDNLPIVGATSGGNTIRLKKLETNWTTQGTPVPAEGELMLARNLATNKMYLMAGFSGSYTAKVELT